MGVWLFEWQVRRRDRGERGTYSLLGKLAGSLVLAVA